jgi:hypothetical protein
LKQAKKAFLFSLEAEGIPAKEINVNCTHEFACVFAESLNDLIKLIASELFSKKNMLLSNRPEHVG